MRETLTGLTEKGIPANGRKALHKAESESTTTFHQNYYTLTSEYGQCQKMDFQRVSHQEHFIRCSVWPAVLFEREEVEKCLWQNM